MVWGSVNVQLLSLLLLNAIMAAEIQLANNRVRCQYKGHCHTHMSARKEERTRIHFHFCSTSFEFLSSYWSLLIGSLFTLGSPISKYGFTNVALTVNLDRHCVHLCHL